MGLAGSVCHIEHEGARIYRGLYICEKTKKKLNADLNAAANIAYRVGYEVAIKKIESYMVTHNGVLPITPARGAGPRPQHIGVMREAVRGPGL